MDAWTRVTSRLIATHALDEDDRRRELALNGTLMMSTLLALFEAAIRLPAVVDGGAGAVAHAGTFALSCMAATGYGAMFVLSRRGRQAGATWGLLAVDFGAIAWLFVVRGTAEPAALVLCAMLIVTAGVLIGSRVSTAAVGAVGATLVMVGRLDSVGVLHPGGAPPDLLRELATCGGFGALALMLSVRAVERRDSTRPPSAGGSHAFGLEPALARLLTARELEVVQLIAAGCSNDEIARQLFVSPRTVHTHVSSALRKTGCSNRTELAVLAINDGAVDRQQPASVKPPARAGLTR